MFVGYPMDRGNLDYIMKDKKMTNAMLMLHFAVFLAGTSGLFGRWISLNETLLVWYRVLLSVLIMGAIMLGIRLFKRKGSAEPKSRTSAVTYLKIMGIGCLLCFHWLFFFGSVKAANVSIGAVCLSLVPFVTAVLEPLITKTRFSVRYFLLSILSVAGVACIFGIDTQFRQGIVYGAISSTLLALMIICNRSMRSNNVEASKLLLTEMMGGGIVLTFVVAIMKLRDPALCIVPTTSDWIFLLLLAGIVTITPYLLKIMVLDRVDAFTVNLVNNMEPVYSIVLAVILFNEAQQLSFAFVVGVALIILSVALQTSSVMKRDLQH